MLIFCFGVLQFGCCWQMIAAPVTLVKYIKSKAESSCGRLGIIYAADKSRHPEPKVPVPMN